MARFSRIEVVNTMRRTGVIPLFYHNDIEVAKKVTKACYDGGARLLELQVGEILHMKYSKICRFTVIKNCQK